MGLCSPLTPQHFLLLPGQHVPPRAFRSVPLMQKPFWTSLTPRSLLFSHHSAVGVVAISACKGTVADLL